MTWTDDFWWYGRVCPHQFDIVSPFGPVLPSETEATFDLTPATQPAPQGWECPRCKTINAPHAMTCQGAGCKP